MKKIKIKQSTKQTKQNANTHAHTHTRRDSETKAPNKTVVRGRALSRLRTRAQPHAAQMNCVRAEREREREQTMCAELGFFCRTKS